MNKKKIPIKDQPPQHTNAFLDLNGVPYLVAEYLDRSQFRQLDRSWIQNEIFIDTTEAMRAVVDITINDIGKRGDGSPSVMGNGRKYSNLLKAISWHTDRLHHRFDVIKPGMIVRVNYRLENRKTGQIIRTTSEDVRVKDRTYFIDINPKDINDNGIVSNMMTTIVSSINNFTHGLDGMILRMTSIQLFYETVKRGYGLKHIPDVFNPYEHHLHNQNRHTIGVNGTCSCDDVLDNPIHPPDWFMLNRFYRFENLGKDITLHTQEIFDKSNRVGLIPCGVIHVNRIFSINAGHRIIFKISVWKNDVVAVVNTQKIAKALGVQLELIPPMKASIDIDKENLFDMMRKQIAINERQARQIEKLQQAVKSLMSTGDEPPPFEEGEDDLDPEDIEIEDDPIEGDEEEELDDPLEEGGQP